MRPVRMIIVLFLSALTFTSCNSHSAMRERAMNALETPTSLEDVQKYALGEWQSLSIELRPTEDRTGSGKINPTYLTRKFRFLPDNKFVGIITIFADNYGQIPLFEFEFKGHLKWGQKHPIAKGAWEIDYVLDDGFAITPKNDQATMMLNQMPADGIAPFQTNIKQDILKKPFPMFNIAKDQIVVDYDLIYFKHGLLFMGAKHVDGTPFDKADRRPHQLQIPLERVIK